VESQLLILKCNGAHSPQGEGKGGTERDREGQKEREGRLWRGPAWKRTSERVCVTSLLSFIDLRALPKASLLKSERRDQVGCRAGTGVSCRRQHTNVGTEGPEGGLRGLGFNGGFLFYFFGYIFKKGSWRGKEGQRKRVN
jgi:hypothetical protein